MTDLNFTGGINIALKIPKARYEQAVHFYKNVLKLETEERPISNPTVLKTHRVVFGANILWLDCMRHATDSEVWLELNTSNVKIATQYLERNGTETCDELEEIPSNMHWIRDPAGTVFILKPKD